MSQFIRSFTFFRTNSGNEYLFDDITGVVLQIPAEISSRIKHILFDSTTPAEALIKVYKEAPEENNYARIYKILETLISNFGAFYRLPMKISTSEIEEGILQYMILRDGLYELLLEVTDNCNFRCRYCVFGGNYKDFRTHGYSFMTLETAIKAIDLYFEYLTEGALLNPMREPTIAFYGGEPLLNFKLIEKCVEYVNQTYSDEFAPRYTITTNASLITKKIAEFLVKNDFDVFISLDGPQEEHNRNRVLANGRGTFDLVIRGISNLKNAQRKHDGSNKEYFALITYDPKSNLYDITKFFGEESPIKPIFANPVRSMGTTYYLPFTEEDYMNHEKMLRELFKKFLNDSRNGHKSAFSEILFGGPGSLMFYRNMLSRKNPTAIFTSTCIPGFKWYVTTGGKIQVCERAPYSTIIRDVNKGLDFSAIKTLIQRYFKLIVDKCNYCGLAHSCARCFAYMDSEDCTLFKRWVIDGLKTAFTIYENNPEYFEKRLSVLKEKGGIYAVEIL
ncbi:radical SAM protein [Thermococcus indicus]|uniref:Radical SAM protein n=1 Tax=Thermococcus indicus TaxID=2586643 RepID=A0A4Y5SLL1_9EURY|nr:radical SAM protein [Thermococcus indicus]QDA31793.1 radical SAM protein [Thermococcus indicus]